MWPTFPTQRTEEPKPLDGLKNMHAVVKENVVKPVMPFVNWFDKPKKTRVSLTLADAVDHSFGFEQLGDEVRMSMMLNFQSKIDFEMLASFLVKRKKKNLLFELLSSPSLKRRWRVVAVVSSFKVCFRMDELALAMQIWFKNTAIMKQQAQKVIEPIVSSFLQSTNLNAYKTYFLNLVFSRFTYAQID